MRSGQRWPEDGMPKCEVIYRQALGMKFLSFTKHFLRFAIPPGGTQFGLKFEPVEAERRSRSAEAQILGKRERFEIGSS
jgi:hypothetical protein